MTHGRAKPSSLYYCGKLSHTKYESVAWLALMQRFRPGWGVDLGEPVMLEGCWTYVVPEQSRGGMLCVNNNIVAGGNGYSSFDGVVVGTESAVQIIILAKRLVASSGPSPWGDNLARYFVT